MNIRPGTSIPFLSTLFLALVAAAPLGQAGPGPQARPDEAASPAGGLIAAVRDATRRFKDVRVALAEGYQLHFGCVSDDDEGAMGLHLVNGALVNDGILDPARPEILLYEPVPGGGMALTGADYLVIAETWDARNAGPPILMGQLFHLFESPNRFGLPTFYTLHVWAWKSNPRGNFTNWNPEVSCDAFTQDASMTH